MTAKYKRFLIRCAKRRGKSNAHYNDYRIARNKLYKALNKQQKLFQRQKDQYRDFVWIKPPKVFSMTQNPHETISFISRLEARFKDRRKVFVDLSQVKSLGDGAIVVLLSWMIRFMDNSIDFNGNYPLFVDARDKLVKSGFFKELYNNRVRNTKGE